MKNIKSSILLVLILSSSLFAQWLHELNGVVVDAGAGYSSDQIYIIVKEDLNGIEYNFTFWKGEFGIDNYMDLIMKNVHLQYILGKAPMAIGVAEHDPNAISAPHFDSIDDKYFSMGNYYFIGRYVQANSINYKIVLEIEGRNGRIGSFPIPDNVSWSDEDQDQFADKEVIVRYVLLDEVIVTELRVKSDEEITKAEFIFTGTVLSAEDTGLGPFYGMTVENPEMKESNYFMVMLGMFDQVKSYEAMVGDKVQISFNIEYEQWLDKIMLLSDFENINANSSGDDYSIIGTYLNGEQGDMGGYIYIKTPDGETTTIMTEFETFDEYIGKEVYVKYFLVEENSVLSLRILE